jgi:hypothetical protein
MNPENDADMLLARSAFHDMEKEDMQKKDEQQNPTGKAKAEIRHGSEWKWHQKRQAPLCILEFAT